jgi:hypothetical protein
VLGAHECAGQVDVDDVLPDIEGELFERYARGESPGVVE